MVTLVKGLPITPYKLKMLNRYDKVLVRRGIEFVDPDLRQFILPGEHSFFRTNSRYDSAHLPTPYMNLLNYLGYMIQTNKAGVRVKVLDMPSVKSLGERYIELPKGSKCAIPGFGLGASGTVFASLTRPDGHPVFHNVVGLEIDPAVAHEAAATMKRMKFQNVEVLNKDMIDHDYSSYKALYFYYPVLGDQFPRLMKKVLQTTSPGTVIFAHTDPFIQDIFFNDSYVPSHPLAAKVGNSEFFTFIKVK